MSAPAKTAKALAGNSGSYLDVLARHKEPMMQAITVEVPVHGYQRV